MIATLPTARPEWRAYVAICIRIIRHHRRGGVDSRLEALCSRRFALESRLGNDGEAEFRRLAAAASREASRRMDRYGARRAA